MNKCLCDTLRARPAPSYFDGIETGVKLLAANLVYFLRQPGNEFIKMETLCEILQTAKYDGRSDSIQLTLKVGKQVISEPEFMHKLANG